MPGSLERILSGAVAGGSFLGGKKAAAPKSSDSGIFGLPASVKMLWNFRWRDGGLSGRIGPPWPLSKSHATSAGNVCPEMRPFMEPPCSVLSAHRRSGFPRGRKTRARKRSRDYRELSAMNRLNPCRTEHSRLPAKLCRRRPVRGISPVLKRRQRDKAYLLQIRNLSPLGLLLRHQHRLLCLPREPADP